MIQKLELKHLAPYLPYGLIVRVDYYSQHEGRIFNFSPAILLDLSRDEYIVKPILRPLSDLTKEIDVNGEKFVPLQYLSININWHSLEQWKCDHKLMNVEEYNNLLSWHFDVFGLIESNLAIDINTLK